MVVPLQMIPWSMTHLLHFTVPNRILQVLRKQIKRQAGSLVSKHQPNVCIVVGFYVLYACICCNLLIMIILGYLFVLHNLVNIIKYYLHIFCN